MSTKKNKAEAKPVAPADNPENIARICELLGEGVPLRQILREEPGMPKPTAFYARIDKDSEQFSPTISEQIAQARARGHDALAAECLEIADDARNDWMDKKNADGEVIGKTLDTEHVQRSKLRIETRLKLLAKWDPKRYGDKLELAGGLSISKSAADMSDAELQAIAQRSAKHDT